MHLPSAQACAEHPSRKLPDPSLELQLEKDLAEQARGNPDLFLKSVDVYGEFGRQFFEYPLFLRIEIRRGRPFGTVFLRAR